MSVPSCILVISTIIRIIDFINITITIIIIEHVRLRSAQLEESGAGN